LATVGAMGPPQLVMIMGRHGGVKAPEAVHVVTAHGGCDIKEYRRQT